MSGQACGCCAKRFEKRACLETAFECLMGRELDRRPIGGGIGERKADLDRVGARIGGLSDEIERGPDRGITRGDIGNERDLIPSLWWPRTSRARVISLASVSRAIAMT